jgi:hypothetical protein
MAGVSQQIPSPRPQLTIPASFHRPVFRTVSAYYDTVTGEDLMV